MESEAMLLYTWAYISTHLHNEGGREGGEMVKGISVRCSGIEDAEEKSYKKAF